MGWVNCAHPVLAHREAPALVPVGELLAVHSRLISERFNVQSDRGARGVGMLLHALNRGVACTLPPLIGRHDERCLAVGQKLDGSPFRRDELVRESGAGGAERGYIGPISHCRKFVLKSSNAWSLSCLSSFRLICFLWCKFISLLCYGFKFLPHLSGRARLQSTAGIAASPLGNDLLAAGVAVGCDLFWCGGGRRVSR